MPLHPQAKAVLDIMAATGFQLAGEAAPIRAMMALAPKPEGEPVTSVVDRTIHANGADIPVRIYRSDPGAAPRPGLVWFHGGGWVIGTLDSDEFGCRLIANASNCVVVSVDYRLAPESKFPTAADDAFAVTKWVAENGAELGIDASRLAVGGWSAGGNLAAVVAQLARDSGGPALRFQALVNPVTNYDFTTASYQENADGYGLTKAGMEWFWGHYLNSEADGASTKASPLRHTNFAGLPPALVITAEYDPLRDEGEAYAEKLRAAGVPVEFKRYDGQAHTTWANPAIDDGTDEARRVGKAVKAALGA
ncbi:MAG: alpha/beta hydrolase [Dehalococcoidia bacterium]